MINPKIFRAYDIRGNSERDLLPKVAYNIGYHFGKINITESENVICIGRDGRNSSLRLYQNVINGLIDADVNVISIGLVHTPLLYFADKKIQPRASIMITGSHNAKDDNGFKMVACGLPFADQKIQNLLHNIQSHFIDQNLSKQSKYHNDVRNIELYEQYVDEILQNCIIGKNLRVAWDFGNGAGGVIEKLLAQKLPNHNIFINEQVDGNFPNHHPDPSVYENLSQLIAVVKDNNCDFGFAFDGDADRIGIISNSGQIVSGDNVLSIFVKDILKHNPNSTIIADVKTSQTVFDQIKQYGGKPLMWKTGHSFIKEKMIEVGAIFAGEMTGHLFFADKYYGYDDGIYAAMRFIDLISRSNESVASILHSLTAAYNTPELRIEVADNAKFVILEQIKQHLRNINIDFNDIDGIRVSNEYGWWLIRASNTQGAIIARCESNSMYGLNILKTTLLELLSQYNLDCST